MGAEGCLTETFQTTSLIKLQRMAAFRLLKVIMSTRNYIISCAGQEVVKDRFHLNGCVSRSECRRAAA